MQPGGEARRCCDPRRAALLAPPSAARNYEGLPDETPAPWWQRIARAVGAACLAALLAAMSLLNPAAALAQPLHSPAAEAASVDQWGGAPRGGYRDTGILLARASAEITPEPMDPSTDNSDTRHAMEKYLDEAEKRKLFTNKKGKKVQDPEKSMVDDPSTIPTDPETNEDLAAVRTAWRTDKLRDMTYTQFWLLTREGRIDKVKITADGRSAYVTTKESAPGGRRTEKVGLPYDPDLMHHLIQHGVELELTPRNQLMNIAVALLRLAFPLWLAMYLVKFSFRLGRKKKRDKLFGGVRMDLIKSKDISISFKDVAGIDQVKAEIQEVVAFLKNPQRFLELGARSPAGVLMVGPPGTGKTLLAKAIAGEAGVPFFSASGTEFMEMFVGVGASRVRDMFEKARKNAPCILFVDEFDGLGKKRSYGGMGGNDESVHTVNQLLTEMDGFEDNTGVVVMAATNRPAALDEALTRPGRFDRIIHLPLPNLEGRVAILEVHSRDKKLSPDVNLEKIARATAGFTGAQLMNLMNLSAMAAVRQHEEVITEGDIFDALEDMHMEEAGRGGQMMDYDEAIVPPVMRRHIAIYEAAKALVGSLLPGYDTLSKVTICPGGLPTGFSYFIPQEELLETRITTRSYMESKIVSLLAGRVGERLMIGPRNITPAGAGDLEVANIIARDMVFRAGFSRRLGPVMLMDNEERYINLDKTRSMAPIGTEMAKIAREEIFDLLDGAETKAYYGLVRNYKTFEVLVDSLVEKGTLSGVQVQEIMEATGAVPFKDPMIKGHYWTEDGALVTPDFPPAKPEAAAASTNGSGGDGQAPWKPGFAGFPWSPYRVRVDLPEDMVFGSDIPWPDRPPKLSSKPVEESQGSVVAKDTAKGA